MLDIVMPRYNEPWETGRAYFDMLACQKGIDFGKIRVILVHDGTEPFPEETFSSYPYRVEQYRIDHAGVSAARNYGMSLADAEWITFCDFDDKFSSVYSLKFVFDVLGTDKFDLLWGPFFVENKAKDGGFVLTQNDKFNLVWIHNKYYRLSFLWEHDLKFNEDLYFCEDSAFNAMVNIHIEKERIGTIKSLMPLYVWSYRDGSATTDKALTLKNMIGHFYRNKYVTEKFREIGHEDADAMAARTLTDTYCAITRKDVPEGSGELEDLIRGFYREHREGLKTVDSETWRKVMKASMKEAKGCGFLNPERPVFGEWLKRIGKG